MGLLINLWIYAMIGLGFLYLLGEFLHAVCPLLWLIGMAGAVGLAARLGWIAAAGLVLVIAGMLIAAFSPTAAALLRPRCRHIITLGERR